MAAVSPTFADSKLQVEHISSVLTTAFQPHPVFDALKKTLTSNSTLQYLHGLGNEFQTEAIPGALPLDQVILFPLLYLLVNVLYLLAEA